MCSVLTIIAWNYTRPVASPVFCQQCWVQFEFYLLLLLIAVFTSIVKWIKSSELEQIPIIDIE